MQAVCGWVAAQPVENRHEVLLRMLGQAPGASSVHSADGPGWGLGVAGVAQPANALHVTAQVTTALVGRVTFADPSLESLRQSQGAARALADAYVRSGERCFQAIRGAFTAVVLDHVANSCVVAIDRMGVHSLHYAPVDGGIVFGSTADAVSVHPQTARDVNLQSLFNYLYFHMVPGPETVHRGQRRLPPGGFARLAGGETRSGTYWKMAYRESDPQDLATLEAEFRTLLEASVRKCLAGQPVGAFLSGGTDSSTIAGMLGRVGGAPAKTYSIGFAAEGYDEMVYARIAARHFGTAHHEYYVTPDDVADLMQRLARFCDQPFGNASAVPAYYCAQMAKSDGVDLMLGGDGGDELFGGNERYARQSIFELYEEVPALLRRCVVEPVLFGIPWGERIAPLRKARSYVRQASVPMPGRLHTYIVLNRIGPERIFTDEFLGSIDPGTPARLFDEVYRGADAQTMLNRMLALDLQFTLADNDLYKVSRMCELAGVDVAYPMLDDDLVAFSATLPTGLKVKGTTLRYFFKRALRDFLPREIIEKRKHGFGLPVGEWMQTHDRFRELAYGAVSDFRARHVVRASFIDEMIASHRAGHAAYWGGEIWVLAILELWLQSHGQPQGRALA